MPETKKTAKQLVLETHPEASCFQHDGRVYISERAEILGAGYHVTDAWVDAARVLDPGADRCEW